MNLRCLLVDDEPPALKVLAAHIAGIPGLEIAGQCHNALDALDLLHRKPVDLVFLDIKMPKLLGTDFLRSLPKPPLVIFVTAYRDYAAEGYELDAVDYLVKPVSFERFLRAISKVRRHLGQEPHHPTPSDEPASRESFIYMKVDKAMQKVLVDDILYIESWKDYVKVYLQGGRPLIVKQSITATENMLSGHRFLRVHRSFIVSTQKITGYTNMSLLVGGTSIPIGRLYKRDVHEALRIA